MDQYQNNFYDDYGNCESVSNFLMNDDQIIQRINFQHQQVLFSKEKGEIIQQLATTQTCNIQTIHKPQLQFQVNQLPKPFQKIRKLRKIQCNSKTQLLNQFTFSGSKNDTVELNTNFKTLFKNFLKESYQFQSDQDKNLLQIFEKSVSSFKAFSQLYKSNLQIKILCKKLIRSSQIIKKIMSSRAKFWMRLQMIKYIQALNKNLKNQNFIKWKSIRKQKY